MVLPSSLLDFLRLGSLRVSVVVNFLNYKSPGLTAGRAGPTGNTHDLIAEVVVFPVVRLLRTLLSWPGGVEDQERS